MKNLLSNGITNWKFSQIYCWRRSGNFNRLPPYNPHMYSAAHRKSLLELPWMFIIQDFPIESNEKLGTRKTFYCQNMNIAKQKTKRKLRNSSLPFAFFAPTTTKKSFSEKTKIPLRAKKNFLGKVLPRFKQLQTRKTLPSSSPSTAQTGRHCKSDLWMVFPSVRIFYSPASENARELSWGEWKMEASRLRSEEEMRKIRISRDSFTRKQKNKSERLFQPSSLKRRRFFH